MNKRTVMLYDSGSVAAGALITAQDPSGAPLDLASYESIEVVVDNTAASVFRDLSLLSYLDNGTTLIETLLLRKVGFGTAPSGSTHAPGAVRGIIGANPSCAGASRSVLYDGVSAADSAHATPDLVVEDLDTVAAYMTTSAGTSALSCAYIKDDGTALLAHAAITAAAVAQSTAAESMTYSIAAGAGQVAGIAHRRMRWSATTAGPGNTTRIVVVGKGRVPGTFAHQRVLPTKAKLTLAAAGAAAARMTIWGR